ADLEHSAPVTKETLLETGSVAKQFTAAAILLLGQQGKLSLGDDVRRYLPELPDYGVTIRIRDLVHQTSGIKDWQAVADLTGWGTGNRVFTNAGALALIARQRTLNFLPGEEFLYSNSNYILMATIVARVSGMSFADYTRRYLFEPAGMRHTQWRDNFRRVVPGRAIAYAYGDKGYETDMPLEDTHGDGGLLTTTEDLLKWNEFYSTGRLGGPVLLRKQVSCDTLRNGRINYYGAGLFVQKNRGWRVIRHTGGTGSYRSYLAWYPELGLSVAWLSNTSRWDSSGHDPVRAVEQLFLPSRPAGDTRPEASEARKSLPGGLDAEGWYRHRRSDYGIQVLQERGSYWAVERDERFPLEPVPGGFRMGSNQLLISKGLLRYVNADGDTAYYDGVAAPDPLVNKAGFTGTFRSAEAQCGMRVALRRDTLYLVFDNEAAYPLKPTYRDAFRILEFGGVVNFRRNARGVVTAMHIGQGRARNVRF
ncbi:MAG: class A beta-lactamase-related serine hydrolase, partial [Chitinophagaceae bacterium]